MISVLVLFVEYCKLIISKLYELYSILEEFKNIILVFVQSTRLPPPLDTLQKVTKEAVRKVY